MRTALFLLLACAACGPRQLQVTMNSDNNSGQSGFATLLDRGSKGMTVTVETSAPDFADMGQVAHIHEGSCGEVGAIKAPLLSLSALADKTRFGSTTEVSDVTFEMIKKGSWLINVHDSRDRTVYVSCGEIPAP